MQMQNQNIAERIGNTQLYEQISHYALQLAADNDEIIALKQREEQLMKENEEMKQLIQNFNSQMEAKLSESQNALLQSQQALLQSQQNQALLIKERDDMLQYIRQHVCQKTPQPSHLNDDIMILKQQNRCLTDKIGEAYSFAKIISTCNEQSLETNSNEINHNTSAMIDDDSEEKDRIYREILAPITILSPEEENKLSEGANSLATKLFEIMNALGFTIKPTESNLLLDKIKNLEDNMRFTMQKLTLHDIDESTESNSLEIRLKHVDVNFQRVLSVVL